MFKIKDKTLLLLSVLGFLAFVFMNIISLKPNRIAQGLMISSFEFFGILAFLILGLWVALLTLAFLDFKFKDEVVFVSTILLVLSLVVSLQAKTGGVINDVTSARVSLAAGFYTQIFAIFMLLSTFSQKLKSNKPLIIVGFTSLIITISYLFISGSLSDLSLFKEYQIKSTQFADNMRIHALLTFASVITGVIIAVPLGFFAYKKRKHENKVMLPLSIIQTIPSLSLFGLLLVPLSRLGKLPFFDFIGVSGIGWAPAYIALTLYTLLPIGRNTLTGFYSVDSDVIESARGMGMSNNQILRKIELPLAFPVIFTGIRIAFIQTIGGAVLAGLVGGGGMGTFVFLGLGEASADLILLGVLPIVFFTVMLDFLLRWIEKSIRGVIYD